MSSVAGKVAVVTGAGSGIGRALAFERARRGARLALSDVDETGLGETTTRTKALGAEVDSGPLDVRDRPAFLAYAEQVADRFGVVHQLYNNAGVGGTGQPLLEADWATVERTIAVDLFGVLHGTVAFLPHLVASGDGHLVNVSSLNGIHAQPGLADYCTAKFGVRGLTEAVRAEMLAARHPVRVTVVHPGGVRTAIATAAMEHGLRSGRRPTAEQVRRLHVYNDRLLRMSPEQAARTIVSGVEAGRSRVLVGADATLTDLVVRLAPSLAPRLGVLLERRLFGSP